jgi:hypothetical protein
MQIAIDQLRNITFGDWENMVKNIEVPLDEGERFFQNLFGETWKRFTNDFREILMSMNYFVEEASPEALRQTSGIPERQFSNILASASDAYIESSGTGYTMHPLTYAFCRAVLNSSDNSEFQGQSSLRFVEYFSGFARKARESKQPDLLEREIRNIIAAARLAERTQEWRHLVGLREDTVTFLRIRGYWQEQTEITQLAAKAYKQLGEERALAECLVDDLGWLFLRFEELDKAEEYIREGLGLFKELMDSEGIAQAMRHLGKLALLKGLDQWYEPDESWEENSKKAERHYSESLAIREKLKQEGFDQRREIADMNLDFGRLYWLQGKKYMQNGIILHNNEFIEIALRKCEQANKISEEARYIFEEIGDNRGIAKAWGNLGNATKEIAKHILMQKEGSLANAIESIARTHEYYEKSLEIAKLIKRKDEIAHALWGLAEVYELFADYYDLYKGVCNTRELLMKSLNYAQESSILYKSLGGRKDINATERLVDRIRIKVNQL